MQSRVLDLVKHIMASVRKTTVLHPISKSLFGTLRKITPYEMKFAESSLAIIDILNESNLRVIFNSYVKYSLADLWGATDTHCQPKIFSLSCSLFFRNFGKIVFWQPHRVAAPSYGESWIHPY